MFTLTTPAYLETMKADNATREVFAQIPVAKKKWEQAHDSPFINLSLLNPHVTPNPVALQAPKANTLGYGPSEGDPETLKAIVNLFNQYYEGSQYQTDEVMVTHGGNGALDKIVNVLLKNNPNNVILTFEGCLRVIRESLKMREACLKLFLRRPQDFFFFKDDFRPTAKGLREAINSQPKARALLLNYPNNPTGISLFLHEAQEIAEVLKERPDLFLIWDDVYHDFNDLPSINWFSLIPGLKEKSAMICSGSKGLLGAPGLRIGAIGAPSDKIAQMKNIQTRDTIGVNRDAQSKFVAAVNANNQSTWLPATRQEYKTNREAAEKAFEQQGFKVFPSQGGLDILIDASHLKGKINPKTQESIMTDKQIVKYFMDEAGVATVPGSGFSINPNKTCLRISCTNETKLLIEAAKRIGDATRALMEQRHTLQPKGMKNS